MRVCVCACTQPPPSSPGMCVIIAQLNGPISAGPVGGRGACGWNFSRVSKELFQTGSAMRPRVRAGGPRTMMPLCRRGEEEDGGSDGKGRRVVGVSTLGAHWETVINSLPSTRKPPHKIKKRTKPRASGLKKNKRRGRKLQR